MGHNDRDHEEDDKRADDAQRDSIGPGDAVPVVDAEPVRLVAHLNHRGDR